MWGFLHAASDPPFYKSSAHFLIYCEPQDKGASDVLLQTLEEHVGRIAADLKVRLKKKIPVEVLPSLTAFHERIQCPNCPDWVVGVRWKGGLFVVSPLVPGPEQTKEGMLKVAVHELTHLLIAMKTPNAPRWINEGLASYEAGQDPRENGSIASFALHSGIPTFTEIEGSREAFENAGGYPFSYTMVEFVIKRWGFDSLLQLMVHYDRFEEVLGVSKLAFWKEWSEWVKREYHVY